MKTYNFKYGHGSVSLSLNEADILAELHGTETPPISDIRSALFASLEQPIDSAPLRQRVRPGDRVALVISDMTRFWMRQDLVIPHLVDYLIDECGVQPEHLTIVVANGTHIGGDEQELRTLVTDGVYNRVRVKNHDCEAKDLAYLGTTPHETPVWIDRTAAEADLVVCLGAATHHVMAGFGGGRKSILPGISGLETIRHNHAYSLDSTKLRTNPAIGNGVLAGNPLHEDMCEAASLVNNLFMVNLVMNADMKLSYIFSGHYLTSWERACTAVDDIYRVEHTLMRRFYEGVSNIPGVTVYGDFSADRRCAIVALNIRDYDSSAVSDELAVTYGIATRPGAHCAPRMHRALGTTEQGAVRFSFSCYNTEREVDAAIEAVCTIAE